LILGEDYFDRIEAELEASKAVIVLWSKDSVKSPWVKAEANRGARSNRLLPVVIDSCTIPLRFEILQAADLRDWRGGAEHPEWKKLVQQVGVLVPSQSDQGSGSAAPYSKPPASPDDIDALVRKVAQRTVEFLSDPSAGGPPKLFSVFREFPAFTDAKSASELWFGLGTKEALFRRLCEHEPRLKTWQNTGGAILLKLAEAQEGELESDVNATLGPDAAPTVPGMPVARVEDVIRFTTDLLANSPMPVPLATVATAIEAEFGDGVRKSRWMGAKTLKTLLTQNGLKVGGKSGYLFDSARHQTPTA
jgi:hypothetical protein